VSDDKTYGIELRSRFDGKGFKDLSSEQKRAGSDAEREAARLRESWTSAMREVRNASAIAFAGISGVIGLTANMAGKQEAALNRSRAAVEISGKAWTDYENRLVSFAGKLQEVTRFADDDTEKAFANLTLATGNADMALEHLSLTADLASFTQSSMEDASRAMAQAIEGETGRLGMLIPELKRMNDVLGENATKSERQAYIMSVLQSKLGGLAEREGKTFVGQMAQAKNAIGDVAEEIGAALLPTIADLLRDIKPVVVSIGEWAREHPNLVKAILGGGLAITGFVAAVTTVATIAPRVVAGIKAIDTAMTALMTKHPYLLAFAAASVAFAWGWREVSEETNRWKAGAGELITDVEKLNYNVGDQVMVLDLVAGRWRTYSEIMLENAAALRKQEEAQKAVNEARLAFFGKSGAPNIEPIQVPYTFVLSAEGEDAIAADQERIRAILDAGAAGIADDENAHAAERLRILREAQQAGLDAHVANEILMTEATIAGTQERVNVWFAAYDSFMQTTQSMQVGYSTFITSLGNTEMTGKKRREAIWSSMKQTFLGQIAQETQAFIFGQLARQAAMEATVGVATTTSTATQAIENQSMIATFARLVPIIAGKVISFYASLGPFAIPAAAGTIAAIWAFIRAARMQSGGEVPGSGRGDRVPTLLESGEIVIRREVAQANRSALLALNGGGSIGGAPLSLNLQFYAAPGMSESEVLRYEKMLEADLPRIMRRAYRAGRMRRGG